jgi:3-hydroxyacyl-[acyl-carrier-protein] dehydratase
MRFILIDRILNVEKNRNIAAIKNVSLSDDLFMDHFPGNPIYPGALILEALSQTGGALIEISNDFKSKAIVIMVENAKYRDYVRPGDQLVLKAEIVDNKETHFRVKAKAEVRNIIKVSADLVFTLVKMEDFSDARLRYLSEILYEIWLKGSAGSKEKKEPQ